MSWATLRMWTYPAVGAQDRGPRDPDVDRARRRPSTTGSRPRSSRARGTRRTARRKRPARDPGRIRTIGRPTSVLPDGSRGSGPACCCIRGTGPDVEAEVHRRGVLVEVAVPVLQLLELAIGAAEVRSLTWVSSRVRSLQLALVADLGGDVGEVAAEVGDSRSAPYRRRRSARSPWSSPRGRPIRKIRPWTSPVPGRSGAVLCELAGRRAGRSRGTTSRWSSARSQPRKSCSVRLDSSQRKSSGRAG